MTDDRMALLDALQKADDGNFLRALAETVLQILMQADVEGVIGAGRYERSGERTTWRNGYRERTLDTRLGQLNLKIPKLRTGTYFPAFLEARKTSGMPPSHLAPAAKPLSGRSLSFAEREDWTCFDLVESGL